MAAEKFRIAVTGDYENQALKVAPWNTLGTDVDIVSFNQPLQSTEQVVAALRDFDAVTLMRERIPLARAALAQLPRLKLIVFTGPSNATLDYAAAVEQHITVCYAMGAGPLPAPDGPNRGGGSPAELTLALLLACAWHLPQADALIRAGGWAFRPGIALRGKTLGIVGYGHIGSAVGRYGLALGMNVLGFSRSLTDEAARADGITRSDLPPLLRTADVLSIHLPLRKATVDFIGAAQIAAMKPGTILINTARALIVNQKAMIDALASGRIAMAGLDVFDQEPLPSDHPLLRLRNVVMTPHIGYVTAGSLASMYAAVIEVLAAYRAGVVKNRYVPAPA